MPLPNAFDIYPSFINFQPGRVIKWVTNKLYQMGKYVCIHQVKYLEVYQGKRFTHQILVSTNVQVCPFPTYQSGATIRTTLYIYIYI
jgi:hypothetical protein